MPADVVIFAARGDFMRIYVASRAGSCHTGSVQRPIAMRPSLRGVSHQYAFFLSLVVAVLTISHAPTSRAAVAAGIHGTSVAGLFGVSALYHRITWSVSARRWMGRLDHAAIWLLIAGTFTPFGVLALSGTLAVVLLTTVWSGALAGIGLHLLWFDAPKWLSATLYVALGWTGVAAVPQLLTNVGWVATLLLVTGGLLYSAGAVIYARRRPDPVPTVFGYHEVFHALVILAVAAHWAAIAFCVLPLQAA
jgi:hemolysin III